MASAEVQPTPGEPSLAKEYGRRRVFVFLYAIIAITLIPEVTNGVIALSSVDDYAEVLLSLAMVVVIAVKWKDQTMPSLKRINRMATMVGVIIILFALLSIALEYGDASELGDGFPTLALGALLVINAVA